MKKILEKLLDLGATHIVTTMTIVGLAVLSFAVPFIPRDKRDEVFQVTLLIAVLKLTLDVAATSRKVRNIEHQTADVAEDFSLMAPPYKSERELLAALELNRNGSLKIICYGTNRFGQLLDVVRSRFPQIHTTVIVCGPEATLSRTDSADIQKNIEDLTKSQNISVETTSVLPTVRAALLRSADGSPVWVCASFYLIHKGRRGLRSEGLSPVLISQVPGSLPMRILSEFIEAEFARLRRPIAGRSENVP
jgi:hypothetical protein